jgi:succinate dehydrogenase / fumarate reductase cytochrome b subunit
MAETAGAEKVRSGAQAPRAFTSNPLITLWNTVIGKKIVMAVTGAVLVGFVIAHMVGNLKIFEGADAINTYAHFLRVVGMPELGYGQLLWIVRSVLLLSVILHIIAAWQLTLMNRAARPVDYKMRANQESTWASRTMRWGGVILLIFIVFHILHFTLGMVGFQPGQWQDLAVYQNVIAGFSLWPVSVFYIIAMAALCLHLDHGIWSGIQTLGWNTQRNQGKLKILSSLIAVVIFLGFISVPVSVMAGWLK